MIDIKALQQTLPIAGLGEPLHYFERVGSTNDVALDLARDGAPDGTTVISEGQTAGRGREGRKWFTPQGAGLAISLILRPEKGFRSPQLLGLYSAHAVAQASQASGAHAEIKWPNDVLVAGRKIAGILTEASWLGEDLDFIVIGIGVNMLRDSVPPPTALSFPATSLEDELGGKVDGTGFLIAVLTALAQGREMWLADPQEAVWQDQLAYRDQVVLVEGAGESIMGRLREVNGRGDLILEGPQGGRFKIPPSGRTMRPIDRQFE